MKLKQIWVISSNGLQLFSYTINNTDKIKNQDNKINSFLKASGIYNILTYFNDFLLGEPTDALLTNDLLWVVYYQTIHHYDTKKILEFAVIAVAQIDLTVPVIDQKRVLLEFCKKIALEFYEECEEYVEAFTNINLKMFEGFRPRCIRLIKSFEEEIAEMLEQRLVAWHQKNK